jgi:hypothetical protein
MPLLRLKCDFFSRSDLYLLQLGRAKIVQRLQGKIGEPDLGPSWRIKNRITNGQPCSIIEIPLELSSFSEKP